MSKLKDDPRLAADPRSAPFADADWLEDVSEADTGRLDADEVFGPAPARRGKQAVSVWESIEQPKAGFSRSQIKAGMRPSRPDKPLTKRERKLLTILVERDGEVTRTQAGIEAGYPKRSASTQVSALLNGAKNPHFVRALRMARAEVDEMYATDRRRHLRKLAELRDAAVESGQIPAAIQAEYRRGQAAEEPIYVERKEVRTGSLDQMSREDVERELDRLRREYGLGGRVIEGEVVGRESDGGEAGRLQAPAEEAEQDAEGGADWLEEDGSWLD
jgi:phage terminase small subunit